MSKKTKRKNLEIIGFTEKVIVIGKTERKQLIARIDTGATLSSIDKAFAKELKLGPVVKKKTVKSAVGKEVRSVINVNFVLGSKNLKDQFSLADRSHMKYKVLIGQNVLKKEGFLIDPTKEL
ncbi:RimK/LysX family protein [Nanoarchaeota archaeon]